MLKLDINKLDKRMNIRKILGERIKRLRKKRNLTQEVFAEMIDIASRNLSRIEVGESFVSADTLDKILLALNVTPEELFTCDYLKESQELLADIYSYLDSIKNNKAQLELVYKLLQFIKNN